ncbi:hypothetical protein FA95DRAFT_784303 [Auriscalpium vulgare]|uniref:Uncharacterized protein n=1 Tax=Auriscalpium vulgare TaxID=40419 RepID=A0ACB8RBG9_9AGAM|nr:hypothetical protein FA95DRAFT_784303 [Auriscalpium vulgare]
MQPLQHRAPVALVHDPSSSTVSRTKQLPGDSIVDAAASIGDLASKVMQFAPVPALSVAADLVVCILNTYMQVKELRERSLKFARRAASALIDLGQCMEDKWDLAPQALLDSVAKFQQALASIRDFMNEIASFSWVSRWRSRRYISGTLDEFEGRLDDAARSFQVASLITIQCALDTLPERLSDSIQSSSARGSSLALSIKEDEFGFRKYHQSEIEISHVRRNAVGWFSDTLGGVAYNRKVIVKKYYLPAQKERWWEEVKMLRDLFHENLPQLVGYSDGRTKTPFILLADVHMSEYDLYIRDLTKTETHEVGALSILKAFRDVLSVADYVQRQLSLSAAQVCQFIAVSPHYSNCQSLAAQSAPSHLGSYVRCRLCTV